MKYFLTADPHFGHDNIRKYTNRPFKNLDEMHTVLIRNWNQRVKKEDVVINVGDFCLAGHSSIDTPKGKKLISSLKIGDEIYSANITSSFYNPITLETSKITKIYKTYSLIRLKIYLGNNTICVTPNHPFAVKKNKRIKWIMAKDLKEGDILYRRKDIPKKIIYNRIKTGNKDKKLYKLGYILGYIYGDGGIQKYNVGIESIDEDGLKRIKQYLFELYNINIPININKREYFDLTIPFSIWESLKQFNFRDKKIKNNSYNQWYRGFLAGFFDAEGSCGYQNHNWYIRIGNTNKNLYDFVVKIAKHFKLNIIENLPKRGKLNGKLYKLFYSFNILTKDTFSFFLITRPAIKRKYPDLKILSNGHQIIKIETIYPKSGKEHNKNKLYQFTNYNLTVEPNNNFFVQGILVHNCFKNSKNMEHKGDGTTNKSSFYEDRLNGKIIFIEGNHDGGNGTKAIIRNMKIKLGGYIINIVHDPKYSDFNVPLNFCGHIHTDWVFKRLFKGKKSTDVINVGCDVWDFRPITIEEILSKYSKWKKTQGVINVTKK